MSAKRRGFTLIELLVVVAIIGILSVVGLIAFTTALSKARDSKRTQDLKALAIGLELHYSSNSAYPTTSGTNCQTDSTSAFNQLKTFMKNQKIPQDPSTNTNYCYYSDGVSYRLFAKLENCSSANLTANCQPSTYNYTEASSDLTLAEPGTGFDPSYSYPTPASYSYPTPASYSYPTPSYSYPTPASGCMVTIVSSAGCTATFEDSRGCAVYPTGLGWTCYPTQGTVTSCSQTGVCR